MGKIITLECKGSFSKTESFLNRLRQINYSRILKKYGQAGVDALASATPVDTGLTASSWFYELEQKNNSFTIRWGNSNIQNGVPIAVILQYGHATKNGGFVQGRDYINSALQPIFDAIASEAWEEVSRQ